MSANFTQTLRYFSEALLLIGTVSTAPGGLNHLYDVTVFGLNTLQQVLLRSLQLYVLVSITPLICWLPVVFPFLFLRPDLKHIMQTERKAHSLPCTLRDELLDSVIHVIQGGGKEDIFVMNYSTFATKLIITRTYHKALTLVLRLPLLDKCNQIRSESVHNGKNRRTLSSPISGASICPVRHQAALASTSTFDTLPVNQQLVYLPYTSIRKHQYKDLTLPLD